MPGILVGTKETLLRKKGITVLSLSYKVIAAESRNNLYERHLKSRFIRANLTDRFSWVLTEK